MEQRTYRGNIDPHGLADALVVRFNHGDLMAQEVVGREGHLMVQIAIRERGMGRGAHGAQRRRRPGRGGRAGDAGTAAQVTQTHRGVRCTGEGNIRPLQY